MTEPKLSDRAREALTLMYQEEATPGLYTEGGQGVHRSSLNKLVQYGLVTVNDHHLRTVGLWPEEKTEVTWQAKLTDAGEAIAVEAALNRIIDRLDEPPYSALCFDLDALSEAIKDKMGCYESRGMTDLDFWTIAAQHKNHRGEEVFRSMDKE